MLRAPKNLGIFPTRVNWTEIYWQDGKIRRALACSRDSDRSWCEASVSGFGPFGEDSGATLRGRHVQEELEPTRPKDSPPVGGSPHISDYWQVISRRLWLVILIFGVTTASAIWAVSQQRTIYETSSSIQINDPLEVTRQLTVQTRGLTGISLFVDPRVRDPGFGLGTGRPAGGRGSGNAGAPGKHQPDPL